MSKDVKALMSVADYFGVEKTHAAVSINQKINAMYGIDLLDLIGATHLINKKQELHLTVTEIGKQLGLSAIATNKLLEALGFQEKIDGHWQLTEIGKPYGVVLDTGKAHKNGTPVQQVKWYQSVIDAISAEKDTVEIETDIETEIVKANSGNGNGGMN